MDPTSTKRVAKLLRAKREALNLSANEVARRAGVDPATVTRMEKAQIPTPRPDNLKAIADVLGLSATDLFVSARWLPEDELPTFQPYLRAKYGSLSDEDMNELEHVFDRIAKKHGYGAGPAPGEDEA